jgi:hypothetical protein
LRLLNFRMANSSNRVWAHTIVRLLAVARRNWRKAVPFWYHFAVFIGESSFGIPPAKNKARRDPPLADAAPRIEAWLLVHFFA